jgi:multidrug efflux pump subunit AcrA (membrane-fusion protein)
MDKLLTKGNFKWMKSLVIVGSITLLASGCSLLPKEEMPLKPPLVKPVKDNLETFAVKRGEIIRRIKGVGIFEPTNIKYHQFTESGGKIKEILVRSGDMVEKGDLLVQLEIEGLDIEMKYKQLDLERAKIGLQQAKKQNDPQQIKLKTMELDIAQTLYAKTLAKFNSKQLYAQMDGQVVFVDDLKPGSWVDPYRVLVNVADITEMRLAYQVISPVDIQDVLLGMEADIEFKGQKYTGKVVQTPQSAPLVDNQQLREKYGRTLYVTVDALPKEASFGSNADLNIVTQKRADTLIIPKRGLRTYFGRDYVQVLDGESRTEVDVEKGIVSATEVEILTGLKEGQIVILQ